MKPKTKDHGEYTCAKCKGVFTKVWSDEEAMVEARDNFGKSLSQQDMDILCDECYQEFMKWLAVNTKLQ